MAGIEYTSADSGLSSTESGRGSADSGLAAASRGGSPRTALHTPPDVEPSDVEPESPEADSEPQEVELDPPDPNIPAEIDRFISLYLRSNIRDKIKPDQFIQLIGP